MCTAAAFKTYFGRNLDLEHRYNETVTVTPRNFKFCFREGEKIKSHPAMIGMAYVVEGFPLYYDAANEHGLFAAGLNFPENAVYMPKKEGFENVAPFEFIPWLLCRCSNLDEAKKLLEHTNILSTDFSKSLPATPLHWFVADKTGSITVEPKANGLCVYENKIGVLTNEPPFEFQMQNLRNYLNLSPNEPKNTFAKELNMKPYSRGMGAIGLPGDLSSASRFVKAAFTKLNSVCKNSPEENITQFFHILGSVEQQSGCVRLENGELEKTVYSSCVDSEKGIYYYKTYENSRITAVDMKKENLSAKKPVSYPIITEQDFFMQN